LSFDILAAIDLRGGKVVRLRQGHFEREEVYSDDPIEVGERFAGAGVRWLHVVDLDAARTGGSEHRDVIGDLLADLGARVAVEVGGGVRDELRARELLAAGARRVVVGTAALTDPQLVRRIVAEHGAEAVAVAIDIRAGVAYGRGWGADGAGPPLDGAIETLASAGVRTFEVTAIDRDGSLDGPDLELLARAISLGAGDIIASGGIRSIADLEAVKGLGCRGAIVGRAIHEGRIALEDLVELATAASAGEDATDQGPGVLRGVTMNEPTA
jgi:phosphoribosylformimino-5-aminoimidazole carboxamide ribotide isomerase